MTQRHPDLAEEQDYIDHAYECLSESRTAAWRLRDLTEADLGGTFQARFERNAFDEALIRRLEDLDLGNVALVFGRIDRTADDVGAAGTDTAADETEAFHIGRLAVSDANAEPVVIDWRAPVAEPFYRATGREPMGLVRRRHFSVDGQRLLGIEDELFGGVHLGMGSDAELANPGTDARGVRVGELRGYSTLIASIERGRTGTLGDIVATIQAEQDEIIRSPQAGVLIVQGGPGTGKTVVALHRAAYLLYTYRFPLEDQGVLVIGPNRVFLHYIEQVLPSLGEAGITQATLADLVPGVKFAPSDDAPTVARVKGDGRMSDVIDRAIRDRQRGLRDDLVLPFRSGYVRLSARASHDIVNRARRRFRRHNAGRRFVENEVWSALAASFRSAEVTPNEVRSEVRSTIEMRSALEWMWPVLTPAQLLHDLFGSMALLRSASADVLAETEYKALYRPWSTSIADVTWTRSDAPLLDDAREVLGPRPGRGGRMDDADEIRTFGHIVIDEVQDLTPMELKMATRRSLNGSLTVVGDLAQATGPLAPQSWDDVRRYLPDHPKSRTVGLSVGYRIPAQIMDVAIPVMEAATPGLRIPQSVRIGDFSPRFVRVDDIAAGTVAEVSAVRELLGDGSVAVVAADERCDQLSAALDQAGIDHGRANAGGFDAAVTVVPVSVVKGLELDGVIVVEPAEIVRAQEHGLRALYVALTRPTKLLSIVGREPLMYGDTELLGPLGAQTSQQA